MHEYKVLISRTLHAQRKVMTELTGEYSNLDNQGLTIEAMHYVVQNITKITSPFMLDFLVGALRHKVERPPRHGRGRCPES